MNQSSEYLLQAVGICKNYRRRTVLQNVDLQVGSSEVVGLLGSNGAGKTTYFYILAGLIAPDQGQVLFEGNDITLLPIEQRVKLGINLLPQESSIFTRLSVLDNLRAVLQLVTKDEKQILLRANKLLKQFAIGHLANQLAAELSGGEKRRVEIARALAINPKLLLLDEPFAALDPITVTELQKLIRGLQQRKISVLISDHNVRETLGVCDRAYIMHEGTLLTSGSPEEITTNQKVRDSYLGVDFSL